MRGIQVEVKKRGFRSTKEIKRVYSGEK